MGIIIYGALCRGNGILKMVFDFVLGTVGEFIEYAQIIVAIFFIYYVYKFFTFERPDADARRTAEEARIGAARGWVKDGWDKAKVKKKEREDREKAEKIIRERKRRLNPILGYIIKAEQTAEKVIDDELKVKSTSAVSGAEHQLKDLEKNLDRTKKALRVAKTHGTDKEKEYLRHLYTQSELLVRHFDNKIKGKIPPVTLPDAGWRTDVSKFKNKVNELKGHCGYMILGIQKLMDTGENTDRTSFTSSSTSS